DVARAARARERRETEQEPERATRESPRTKAGTLMHRGDTAIIHERTEPASTTRTTTARIGHGSSIPPDAGRDSTRGAAHRPPRGRSRGASVTLATSSPRG